MKRAFFHAYLLAVTILSISAISMVATALAETSFGTDANDNFGGTEETDIYYGRMGNDILGGGDGDDFIDGGTGIDRLYGGGGDDDLSDPGYGDDNILFGGKGDDILSVGRGNFLGDGVNRMYGNDGNDVLQAITYPQTTFNATMVGGPGNDTMSYNVKGRMWGARATTQWLAEMNTTARHGCMAVTAMTT